LENAALVAPGSPVQSVLLSRINRLGEWQMPPLARNCIDQTAIETITCWIRSLPPITAKRGLFGQYYMGGDFNDLRLTRTDSTINFAWGNNSPDGESLPADNFSVRWTGFVTPKFTERYTFQTISDDGVRLWINGQLLIDDWFDHAPRLVSNSIDLTAGIPYSLKLEYYESIQGASISLSWSSSSQPLQIIPGSALSSAGTLPRFFPPYLYFNHEVRLTLNAESVADYEIQFSRDLLDWHSFRQLPAFRGGITFPNPSGDSLFSFFRVVISNPQ